MKDKSLIFDADNTLYKLKPKKAYKKQFSFLSDLFCVDVNEFEKEWKKIVKKNILSASLIKRSRKFSLKEALNILLNKKKTVFDKNIIEKRIDESLFLFYEELLKSGIKFDKKIPLMILRLKKKYNLFVASDEYEKFLEKKLSFMFGNLKYYFDDIVSCQRAGTLKPSKKFYEILIKKHSLNLKNCIIIGDDWKRDLKIAKKAGITTVLVSNIKEGNPDFCIKKLCQLEEILALIK